jgi:hypothetical protein
VAIAAASTVVAEGSAMAAALARPESILACGDGAADDAAGAAAVADRLAAMAAAAIANGAVALPEVGGGVGAAGVTVTATVTGIAVAMALVTVAASCCAEAVGPVEEPAAEVSPEDDVAFDFAASDFELPDFTRECVASVVVPELALEAAAVAEAL